jgi:hypothetical protein
MEKSVEECNAYSDGWNDKEAGSDPQPPTDPALKRMYDLGYNDASESEQSAREMAYIDQRTQDYHEWRNRN